MKKIILSFIILSLAGSLFAQEAPRNEFTVSLAEQSLTLKPGETKNVSLTLSRSKSFSKSKATLGLSSGLPQGISVVFSPAEEVLDSSEIQVTANESVKPGAYTVIIKSTMQNKNKGATLKVVVTDKDSSVVSLN